MGRGGGRWGVVVVAAVWLAQASVGCSGSAEPLPRDPEHDALPERPRVEPPVQEGDDADDPAPEEPVEEYSGSTPPLSCAQIVPGTLGSGRALILPANGPEAACGPGTSEGTGTLALQNDGPLGVTAWDIVLRDGEDTGNTVLGGDFIKILVPLRQGFHLITQSEFSATLRAYAADGTLLSARSLAVERQAVIDIAADPRGGSRIALWTRETPDTQVLTLQSFNGRGEPRAPPVTVLNVSMRDTMTVLVGVDTRGRTLLLWRELGDASWVGQWRRQDGSALTAPFPAADDPSPTGFTGGVLSPLVGGGLAFQLVGQWVRRFPSGEARALPAPTWLASRPGTSLSLIRQNRAYSLAPPPTLVTGSGCQESLLFFTSDGGACGELNLPLGGATCDGRRAGVGVDGTVVQQIDLNIPANNQCAWRWWSRLLR
ncbi:hypothetical protein OV208_08135 [Corallococcus sp. bb12-1]|uniref:hypothetical protein n=1 Tax=Corallococcus sp. bb12-1 TaxID=2996784 RepID=UPI002270E8CB|nr:hypothetical protein [Corallococcus sp. bb12-1]MCY1041284.1 hypothetical protein [Corallococcus sp. bb12-1]